MNKSFINTILYILIGLFAFFILENLSLYLIPFILFEIIFIINVLNLALKKQKNISSVIISSIGNFIILLFFVFSSKYEDYRENIVYMIGLTCCIVGILNAFKYFKETKTQLSSIKANSQLNKQDNSKKTFSIGIISRKWHRINLIYIVTIITTTSLVIAFFILTKNILIMLLGFLLIVLSFFIFVIFKTIADQKPLTKYANTLNYQELEKEINEINDNPRVHFETKNYYLMLLCAYSLAVDYQKYNIYFELIKKPTFKAYELTYDGLFLHCFLDKEDFVNVYNSLCDKYKNNRNALKVINNFYKQWKIVILNQLDDDINKICPLNNKLPLISATNTYIQAMYYLNNNDTENGLKLANLFLSKYSSLKEFADKLNEKINQL